RTPRLLKDYDFPVQPLGRMHYALYAAPERAEELKATKITDWPRMRVAYSPVSQGQESNNDRVDYFKRMNLSPEYVEYPTSKGAVEALQKGEVDVLFLYTPVGRRPEGVEEIVPIGARNVYFAVRKDRPELMERLAAAYREWYIDSIDKRDLWSEEMLGIPKPEKRVRVAAYNRGDLFQVAPDGRRSGSIEEWLRALCEITGWELDYVYGDYDQSLADVENGRLDLVGGIGYTPEYAERFLFPHTPIGILRVYLWAHRKTPYKAGRPETWKGMTIGTFAGAPSIDQIREQVAKNTYGIQLREFGSDRELGEAYEAGDVDACVAIEMPMLANDRALRFYGAHQMYLVCATNQPRIFGELERALDRAGDDFPKYVRMLSERHYGVHSGLSELSIAEAEWLAKRQRNPAPVVIDFSPWPFDIVDKQGRPEGFPKALLEALSRRTGLKFVPAEQTGLETAEAKFLRGDTQLWVPYPVEAEEAKYGAVTVFAEPVPPHCAQAFEAEDLLDEFELLARPETPDELVSILRKTVAGISSARIQDMFTDAMVERMSEKRLFGLDEEDLKHYAAFVGLGFFALVTLYGAVMMV
ncbi:MAG: transporter substrate-binding domain-containing protein, partial [Kiritimatiellae bacterium]|nr:transporter substrate-binding domain-containing protein [Kiritimatiellia bacterium]